MKGKREKTIIHTMSVIEGGKEECIIKDEEI